MKSFTILFAVVLAAFAVAGSTQGIGQGGNRVEKRQV